MNRTKLIVLSVVALTLVTASAVAAGGDLGITPLALNGVKHAVKKDGSLKPNAVGHRQIRSGAISCQKLNADLQQRVCGGVIGIPGDKGVPGANGTNGASGTNGTPGEPGKPGDPGKPGTPGATGTPGPAGHDATNPLIFGPYNSGSTDSGVCGIDWANDTYTRTYIVDPQPDGSFHVTELYNGIFETIGNTPTPNGPCEEQHPVLAAGIPGTFYGDYAVLVPAPADFNQNAICPAGCSTSDFFASVFGLPTNFLDTATYAWEFYYATGGHGSWANTDHGNTGNIT